ncbi:MAG: CarD family transcriptional regulator, partial [Pseudomonadota bacterium]
MSAQRTAKAVSLKEIRDRSKPSLKPLAEPSGAAVTFVDNVPDGMEGEALAVLSRAADGPIVFVARDGQRQKDAEAALQFFAPEVTIIRLPAWDSLPYDRASPSAVVQARRTAALAALAEGVAAPAVLMTTANAIVQKVPTPHTIRAATRRHRAGADVAMNDIIDWLEHNAFVRTPTVREAGEYAVRGGIVDLFAPGADEPVRLDFFGDTLETIRPFDPETQRTTGQWRDIRLVAMSEVVLTKAAIGKFREGYLRQFGAAQKDDILYHSISEGVRAVGIEHFMPLFHDELATVLDYVPGAPLVIDHLAEDAIAKRVAEIEDHYESRLATVGSAMGAPYNPLPVEALYVTGDPLERFDAHRQIRLSPFRSPDETVRPLAAGGRVGRSFAAERAAENINIFQALVEHVEGLRKAGLRVIVAAWSAGSRDRLAQVLADQGLIGFDQVGSFDEAMGLDPHRAALAVLEIEHGFETADYAIIAEQDVLGDRLVSGAKRRKRDANAITEAASLAPGDLVVHVDHGIGRFVGLKTLEAAGAPHDCVEILYHKDDKLYLPVENIDLLSRYGSDSTDIMLDRLGGAAWQARKAKMKQRVREIADTLIKTAAARLMKKAPVIEPPTGVYDEFVAKFPYDETEDQLHAIDAVADDLAAGRPMDRLVCGDVGF